MKSPSVQGIPIHSNPFNNYEIKIRPVLQKEGSKFEVVNPEKLLKVKS